MPASALTHIAFINPIRIWPKTRQTSRASGIERESPFKNQSCAVHLPRGERNFLIFAAMLRHILSWGLIALTWAGSVSAQTLSDRAEVSLLTCGPGTDLYATFGHSALQISDPVTGVDRVYNYGTFDFDTEGFYLKFTRGKLNYILSVSGFEYFLREYQYSGRWVYRQVLDLNPEQAQALFDYLEWNALPENREYKYDFFYDNCSTRIRDVLGWEPRIPLARGIEATYRWIHDDLRVASGGWGTPRAVPSNGDGAVPVGAPGDATVTVAHTA